MNIKQPIEKIWPAIILKHIVHFNQTSDKC